MFYVKKSIDLDFAHNVSGHTGACINIHGHTWKFEVTLKSEQLDSNGFVVDFKELKRRVLEPVHTLLDHAYLISDENFVAVGDQLKVIGEHFISTRKEPCEIPMSRFTSLNRLSGVYNLYPGGMKIAVFPINPTSEWLAKWLFDVAMQAFASDRRIQVFATSVYETMHPVNSVATYMKT